MVSRIGNQEWFSRIVSIDFRQGALNLPVFSKTFVIEDTMFRPMAFAAVPPLGVIIRLDDH